MSPAPHGPTADPDEIIADLQRELAVCRAELDQRTAELSDALEQQTAATEVLGVINSSPGDLAPVFDSMLDKALRLCGADFGNLLRYDGKLFHVASAVHGNREIGERNRGRAPFPPPPGGLLDPILQGEDVVYVEDLMHNPAYHSVAEIREMVDRGGYRSLLNVALRKDTALLGVIGIFRKESRPFGDKQIALLHNFAAQAVIAMENARLLTETREALEQQTATAEVLQVINSSPGDLMPVFETMLDKALKLCDAAFAVLRTYDGEFVRTTAQLGVPAALDEFMRKPNKIAADGSSATGSLLAGEPFLHIVDIRDSDSYRSGHPFRRALADLGGARTTLWMPLQKEGGFLGTIILYRQQVRSFTDKEIALLENFAAQAVIAMENARLLTQLQQRTRDLEESLKYQTATGDVLKVISRSTFDLQPVLGTLVETAARLCNADMGFIHRKEGEFYYPTVNWGFPPEFETFVRARGKFLPNSRTLSGRTILEQRIVRIDDYAADPDLAGGAATVFGKARTGIGVPLLREGELIGVIALARLKPTVQLRHLFGALT